MFSYLSNTFREMDTRDSKRSCFLVESSGTCLHRFQTVCIWRGPNPKRFLLGLYCHLIQQKLFDIRFTKVACGIVCSRPNSHAYSNAKAPA